MSSDAGEQIPVTEGTVTGEQISISEGTATGEQISISEGTATGEQISVSEGTATGEQIPINEDTARQDQKSDEATDSQPIESLQTEKAEEVVSASPRAESDTESKIKQDENISEKDESKGVDGVPREESEGDNKSSGGRPPSTDANRPKSGTSAQMFMSAKGKKKKKNKLDPDAHQVTFTVTISMAVPTDDTDLLSQKSDLSSWSSVISDEDQPDLKDMIKKEKRTIEKPRPQRWYHLEYYLLPDEDELIKTDVISYGPAVKIFLEHDSKVLRTWQEGDLTWIAWTHNHTVTVSRDLLLKLFNHKLELRIWDETEKMKTNSKLTSKLSTSARWDRPLNFKLPSSKGDEEKKGVKGIVLRQVKSYTKLQPKKHQDSRPIPTQVSFAKRKDETEKTDQEKPSSPAARTLVGVKKTDSVDGRSSFSRLGRLAGDSGAGETSSTRSKDSSERMSRRMSKAKMRTAGTSKAGSPTGRGSSSAQSVTGGKPEGRETAKGKHGKKSQAAQQAAQQAADIIFKNGNCMVPMRLANLFTGAKGITCRLDQPIPGLEDSFISLKLDQPLLSDKQMMDLNPMIIRIKSCKNLPETPLTHQELKMKCKPVHLKYKFYRQPEHISTGREHSNEIYFDDVNIVLTGTLEMSELRQYLIGPPLNIEVHDRDRKEEDVRLKPTLFGDDLEDEKISNVGTVTSRRTLHNAFKGRDRPWDPYGVGKLDLSELLLGHKYLHLKVSIQNCPLPDVLGQKESMENKLVGFPGAVDGPVDRPMPAGHYVHANTSLKVKIDLAYPLITPVKLATKQITMPTPECPFGRIVFIFGYKNTKWLHRLQNLVTELNAQALELDDMPEHVISAALSTYKLSVEQQRSRTLNIVTGFQVMDGWQHLFVLEGLKDRAVHILWDSLPKPENSDVKVLYNSDLSFSDRLYGPLDVDLCRIKLHEPLSQIVQQPLLYVRDMVPKPCFEALVKLNELTKLEQMKNVVRNELFPTADMVVSMSKEFGVPLTQEDFEELQEEEDKPVVLTRDEPAIDLKESYTTTQRSRNWTPIDHFNPEFMNKMADRDQSGMPEHNFIQDNIREIKLASDINRKEKELNKIPTIHADVKVAHNYSSQTLNSTELAKEKLRQMLAAHPDTRYTYCQDFHHSMTVVPVNVEALRKQAEAESKAQWKTEKGFIYPGMKTTLECNVHPNRPDTARREELTEEWRENFLHVGLLQPPLERDRFPWEERYADFELYKRPQSLFGEEPVTIHLAGQKLKEERLSALRKDIEKWKSKVVVDDSRQYFHRCLLATELDEKAQNQVGKLKGLLKDPPKKISLRRPGMHLRDVPPLNVVLNPSVDTAARLEGRPIEPAVPDEDDERTNGFKPGPFELHGWNLERNKIPAYNYEHEKFASEKGHDFNTIHKERNKLWRKPIIPLSDAERDNHLFRIPDDHKIFGMPRPLFEEDPRAKTSLLVHKQTEFANSIQSARARPTHNALALSGEFPYANSSMNNVSSRGLVASTSALPKVITKTQHLEAVMNLS